MEVEQTRRQWNSIFNVLGKKPTVTDSMYMSLSPNPYVKPLVPQCSCILRKEVIKVK